MVKRLERLSGGDLKAECVAELRVDDLDDQPLLALAPEEGDLDAVVGAEVEFFSRPSVCAVWVISVASLGCWGCEQTVALAANGSLRAR
jgi:hypothetical protein